MRRQRGFSLLEVLVASAIAMTIGWQLLTLTHAMAGGARRLDQRLRARVAADRLVERLTSDAAAAWSLFVPSSDRFGRDNADGHELDFVAEDRTHRTFWWAYLFESGTHRVTRYGYVPGGPSQAGEIYGGVDAFSAHLHPVRDLVRSGSSVYDPLFSTATVTNVEIPFGWMSGVAGGNRLADVRYRAGDAVGNTVLASGGAPSRFTVVFSYTPAPSPPP